MGILDPDSVTQKYEQYIAKAKSGQALFIFTGWDRETAYAGQPEEGFAGIPVFNNNKFVSTTAGTIGDRRYAISAKSEHPDRAMDLFNYICSVEGAKTITNGIKGQTWDTVEGVEAYTAEVESILLAGKNDAAWKKQTGVGIYPLFCGLDGTYKDDAGNYIDIKNSEGYLNRQTSTNPKLQDFMAHFNYKTPGEPWFKVKNYNYNTAYGGALPTLPDDLKVINDNLNNMKNTDVYKVILAKDDAEFSKLQDEFISKLMDMGAQKLMDWSTEQWNKLYPEISAIVGK